MQILIVDDEEILRMDLKNALERVSPGNQYYLAESYDEAIAFVREQPLDIAFLDIQMPSKNGLLLAQEIKKTKPGDTITLTIARVENNQIDTFDVECTLIEAKS